MAPEKNKKKISKPKNNKENCLNSVSTRKPVGVMDLALADNNEDESKGESNYDTDLGLFSPILADSEKYDAYDDGGSPVFAELQDICASMNKWRMDNY